MVNQSSSLVAALFAQAMRLNKRANRRHNKLAAQNTMKNRRRYLEAYRQEVDAWTTYWRIKDADGARFVAQL